MKYVLPILTLLISSICLAGNFDIKPGLWNIDLTVERNGVKIKPQEQMEKALAMMPEEQRKKIMETVAKTMKEESGGSLIDMKSLCMTQKMLDDGQLMGDESQDKRCTFKNIVKTANLWTTEFTCDNGSKGKSEWKRISNKEYSGITSITDESNKLSKVSYRAKFKSDKCR